MKVLPIYLILFLLIFSFNPVLADSVSGTVECGGKVWECYGDADDYKKIQSAIDSGNHVKLNGYFVLYNPLVLDSDTVLDGQSQTTITIPDNVNRLSGSEFRHEATRGYAKKMIPLIRADNCENIEIKGIHFDGNADGIKDLITGRGFFNFIMPTGCTGVSVHDCSGENSLGDFLRATKCTDVKFYNIEAKRLGHEALFAIRSSNIEMYGCKIDCRINNAFRIMGSDNAYIHDNYVTCTAYDVSAGPGGQVDVIEDRDMNVEICNNIFEGTGGPGLWIVGDHDNYKSSKTSVYIHHNAFLKTGWDGRDWQGGVLTSVVHNVRIENNVFDGCSNSGVVTYRVKGLPTGTNGADFTVSVRDNIITNTKKGRNTGSGIGYGLSNPLSHSHRIISEGNVLWNNAGGNYNNCYGNDLIQDPKIDPGSSGWRWTGFSWECDYVSTGKIEWDTDTEVDKTVEDIDYEPIPEREFDSIFDILDLEFTDTGRTEQTVDDIKYEVKETTSGLIAGYVKIIGFKDVVIIDNKSYIPDENAIMVKYEAVKSPDLVSWTGRIKKITKNVEIKLENGTADAVLTVKTDWYTIKENKITGERKKSKTKTSTAVFRDSCPAPEILPRPTQAKGILYEYPINSLAYVPSNGLTAVEYEYDGEKVKHVYMLGERNQNENGVTYTNFSKVNYWVGDLPHQGEFLFINGSFDPEKLTVTAYTPYESFQVTHFDHIKKDYPEKFYADWLFPSFGLFLILGFGAWYYIRKILY